MASKKKDFTEQEMTKYAASIGGIDTNDTADTNDTETTVYTPKASRGGRKGYYNGETKKEYRFTCRMPGEYGAFLQEWAWLNRSTITEMLQELVKKAMDEHPEVFESMDALNKKQGE